ncbi:MAG: hypothetical protein AAF078_00130 [Planctomycetota bacterium]
MVFFWVGLAVAGALGLGGLVLGWRGRLVGSAPHCRGCGFNLTGIVVDGMASDATCPECGRGLASRHAVRIGERRRRWGVAGVSGLVLLLVMGTVGLRVAAASSYATVVAFAPTPVLMWVYQGDATARDELVKRIDAGSMSRAATDAIVSHALAMQANAAVPWEQGWGEAIEAAWRAGQLSQADVEAYLLGGVSVVIRARPRTQMGRQPDVYAWWGDVRYGAMDAEVALNWTSLAVNDEPAWTSRVRSTGQPDLRYEVQGGSRRGGSSTHVAPASLGETVGVFALSGEMEATVTQTGPIPPVNPASPWQPMLATGRATPRPVSVEIVAESTGNYDLSEAATQAIRESVHVWRVREVKAGGEVIERLRLAMRGESIRDVKVWARYDEAWHDLSWQYDRASTGDQWVTFSYRLDRIEDTLGGLPPRLTLLMRTGVDAAETTTNLQRRWWLGEALLVDVPLDSEPLEHSVFGRMWSTSFVAPQSLVKPMVRSLTLEEVERDEAEPPWPPPLAEQSGDQTE